MGQISLNRLACAMNCRKFPGRCLFALSALFLAAMLSAPFSAGVIDLGEGDATSIELEESYLGGQRGEQNRNKLAAATPASFRPNRIQTCRFSVQLPINFYSERSAHNGIGGHLIT